MKSVSISYMLCLFFVPWVSQAEETYASWFRQFTDFCRRGLAYRHRYPDWPDNGRKSSLGTGQFFVSAAGRHRLLCCKKTRFSSPFVDINRLYFERVRIFVDDGRRLAALMTGLGSIHEKWRGRIIRYAPLFLWLGVIFFLSSGLGSMERTSFFFRPILQFLFPSASEETLRIFHLYIRKCAHFTEYSILAFLAFRAFSRSYHLIIRKYRYLLPLVTVLTVASIDEFNQSFEPSRTGSFRDVLLDLSGGVAMTFLLWLFTRKQSLLSENVRSSGSD